MVAKPSKYIAHAPLTHFNQSVPSLPPLPHSLPSSAGMVPVPDMKNEEFQWLNVLPKLKVVGQPIWLNQHVHLSNSENVYG